MVHRRGSEPVDVDINSRIKVDEGKFEEGSEKWMSENKSTVRDAMRWVIFGAVVVVVSTAVFLFSEIRHAILVKDLDSLAQLPRTDDLVERTRVSELQRPYLSIGAGVCMTVGIFIVLSTVCNIVSSLLEAAAGYRYRGCWHIAALTALVATAVWSLMLLAVSWALVRPYAAAGCFVASATGALSLSTVDGPTFLLWAVATSAAGFALVSYGGPQWLLDAQRKKEGEREPLLPE